jgi:hypothetical protein
MRVVAGRDEGVALIESFSMFKCRMAIFWMAGIIQSTRAVVCCVK